MGHFTTNAFPFKQYFFHKCNQKKLFQFSDLKVHHMLHHYADTRKG